MDKILETLKSRKAWITTGMIAMAIVLFAYGQIDIDKMTDIIRWAAGLYVGGLSVIDAFDKLLPTIRSLLGGKE